MLFIVLVISYIKATPTGASVFIVNIAAFLLFWAAQCLSITAVIKNCTVQFQKGEDSNEKK
jgi:hypothetical protein